MNNQQKVKAVVMAYQKYVCAATINPFIRLTMPDPAGRHYGNCVAFYDAADAITLPLISLMILAMDSYSTDWCEKIFHRPYAPMTLAVSDKNLNRILRDNPMLNKTNEPDKLAEFYFNQLKEFGKEKALDMIEYGFFPSETDKKIKEQVIALLEKVPA